jgi:nucleoside-diphosphate-sugar epimerase
MTTIVVTGAAGFVGSHLVPALVEAGHRVIALSRTDDGAARVERRLTATQGERVETRQSDVTRLETLGPALAGADAVLHLAAIPRDWDGGASLRLVNTEGTRNVLRATHEAGIRRFVHLGAMGVVDDPDLHYGSSKAKAIELVKASGLDWTVLSPSVLFGPRDGFFNLIAGLVRISPGLVPITGRGTARFQPLAIGDLTRVAVLAFEREETVGHEYLLGGPGIWTYREIVEEVLRGMGTRRLLVPLPVPLIRLVAASAELVRLPFPVATDQLRQLRFDNVGPSDGVREAFGFEPRPMAGGLTHLRARPQGQEPGDPLPSSA